MIITALSAIILTSTPAPKATVQAMFDAFNHHDAKAMEKLYADDARLLSSDFCSARGRQDVQRTYTALFTAMPDLHDTVETIVAEGDVVAVRFVAKSEHANLQLPMVTFIRVKDGLIEEDDTRFAVGSQPCSP
jgi:predicted SnoaL-like aldol condensation-catalyzing enzyme